jgi:bacillithiol synthase
MSGAMPVKTQCLPFSQIPHTTRIFADFLSWSPNVQPFYSRPPHFQQWVKDGASRVTYDSARRQGVSAVLKRQNEAWSVSAKTLENIERLRAGACAVVTGQQVALFGGPAFSLYKALTAVKLAEEASAAGVDCVPVFWLATEDHDLQEVSQVALPGTDGCPQELSLSAHVLADAPVSSVRLGEEIREPLIAAGTLLGEGPTTSLLAECYREGETLGNAFARLFANLFGDWGVILLDASDPELHQIAEPVYRAAAEQAVELDGSLLARGKALENAGYQQQVKVTESSTLLFALQDGARVPVHRRASGAAGAPNFLIGEAQISQAELLRRITAEPQHFSANVLLRPVVQDYLLPTLAYTGGAAEVAYFAQAAVVYEALLGRVTPVIPRFSATIIEPKLQGLLERYGLGLPDVLHGPDPLLQRLAGQALPQELQAAFDKAGANLEASMAAIRELLERLDKTLVDAANNAAAKMHHQLEGLQTRAARAEARQSEVLERHARLLSHALYPNKALQEREVAGIYFVARYGKEFLSGLYEAASTDCLNHRVVAV